MGARRGHKVGTIPRQAQTPMLSTADMFQAWIGILQREETAGCREGVWGLGGVWGGVGFGSDLP